MSAGKAGYLADTTSEIASVDTPVGVTFKSLPGEVPPPPASSRFVPQLLAFYQPHHPVSEQYREVLGGMVTHSLGNGAPVLLLAAPVAGIGTTTVVLNLAISRATQGNARVLVVDGNLGHPGVAKQLGLPNRPSLQDVVSRTVPLGRAIQATGQTGLWVLTAGEPIPKGRMWPANEALRSVLQQLRRQFDWILVDGPSWDRGPEIVCLAGACDYVYLVLRPDMVETPVADELTRMIQPLGSQHGGYILTQRA
jgi:Mrp family chromosome partitioning ATPase